MQAIDRSVARAEVAKGQGSATFSLGIDDTDGQQFEDQAEADVAPEFFFGHDDDNEEVFELPTESRIADVAASTGDDRIRRVLEAKVLHGLPIRRKLENKVAPQATDYTDQRLVTKAELKRLKGIESEAARKKLKVERSAASQAAAAITNQPELTHDVEHRAGAAVVGGPGAPHVSHDMRHFASADAVIIFCDTCGRWQRHGAGRSKLGDPCATILEGMKSQRKLLRHQIVPVSGAKLPASVKTSGGKKC